ncbi:MAG: hypothetical protein HWE10_01920 [Gammaproteobacteria bacterium]|nr:hypothetical protein [Gammaproteobacteria bacterium]
MELLLVLTLMAFLFSMVKIPDLTKEPFDVVENEAKKVAHLIDLASDYAVLNNALLGFAVKEQSYAFLAFDGERWLEIPEAPFIKNQLEENLLLSIQLDGLEWQEQSLISAVEWINEEEQEEIQQSLDQAPEDVFLFPQVFILPSGEISPFDLDILYSDGFDIEIAFKVRGEFTAPVKVYDPQQIEEL